MKKKGIYTVNKPDYENVCNFVAFAALEYCVFIKVVYCSRFNLHVEFHSNMQKVSLAFFGPCVCVRQWFSWKKGITWKLSSAVKLKAWTFFSFLFFFGHFLVFVVPDVHVLFRQLFHAKMYGRSIFECVGTCLSGSLVRFVCMMQLFRYFRFVFVFFSKCFHRRWRPAEQQQQQPEESACKDSCIRNDRYLCLQWINVVFVCDLYMCECVDVEHESRAKIANLCAHSIVLFQPFNVHLLQWIFFCEWICWQKKTRKKNAPN